jgi:uncharacterized protein YidB (DUF937 family)
LSYGTSWHVTVGDGLVWIAAQKIQPALTLLTRQLDKKQKRRYQGSIIVSRGKTRIQMSILTEVSKLFESTARDSRHQSLVIGAVSMLTSHEGGLNALTQAFERNGLGHIIRSWIGNGENSPISPDQLKAVLGNDGLANLANKAGISPETATQYLTKSLPSLVDALTPNGKVDGTNDLLSRGKDVIAMFTSRWGGE